MRPVLRAVIALVAFTCAATAARVARADCTGPAECCITDPAQVTAHLPESVRVGVRILRLNHINERDGEYGADVLILGRYPAGGLWPNLSVRNAGETVSVVSDTIVRSGDFCYRARRIIDNYVSWFRLRRFPFDRQRLQLILEDIDYDPAVVTYENELWPNSISGDAFRELEDWKFIDYPTMTQHSGHFAVVPGGAPSRLLMIEIPVARLWEFYLTRYFLPLLLIVALAYALFWIKPDDLQSSSAIGITCVLAIIAFQITQADTLPHVAYLTLADRVYIVCYVATAFALAAIVHEAYLSWTGRFETALAHDKKYRLWFPIVVAVGLGASITTGWFSQRDAKSDIPNVLAPLAPPSGEVADEHALETHTDATRGAPGTPATPQVRTPTAPADGGAPADAGSSLDDTTQRARMTTTLGV